MIGDILRHHIEQTLLALGLPAARFQLEYPVDLAHGDYAANVALALAKETGKDPAALARRLSEQFNSALPAYLAGVESVGGFVNFFLSPKFFADELNKILRENDGYGRGKQQLGQKVMVEYTDPNPFKEFHIGHLMSNIIGEAISRLIEFQGAEVKRACYQGDIGLHVAKAIWGSEKLKDCLPASPAGGLDGRAKSVKDWGQAYAAASRAYEEDPAARLAIEELNQKIYARSDGDLNRLYDEGRRTSLAAFEKIYQRLGTEFDFYFFESEMAEDGLAIVKRFLEKGVFKKSAGAVVFCGEKFSPKLHTRVYITSRGLPTYEAKELGLHFAKERKYSADLSVVITANEQDGVFKVGLEALRQIDPVAAGKVRHLSHGMLRQISGKMSSRSGNVVTAESLIDEARSLVLAKIFDRELAESERQTIADEVAIAAIKYSILKQSPGRDIVFDPEKSISFEGDSGPYLQYSYVRARSVLEKAGRPASAPEYVEEPGPLLRLLPRFPEVVGRAAAEFAPQRLAAYLIELAGAFNSFYAKEKIISSEKEEYRLALTAAVARALKNGLWLLGISAPERM